MANSFSYAYSDYPEMEDCPGKVTAATKDEVWKLMELHATVAHGENPSKWSQEDRSLLGALIKEN